MAEKFIKHRLLLFFIFAIASVCLLSGGKTHAASTSTYPETWASGHYLTTSVNGNGINLNAPISYMKVKFTASTYYYDIEVFDGCWWRGAGSIDGGSVYPSNCVSGDVEFSFCPSTPSGTFDANYKNTGQCYRTDPAGWPNGKLGPQVHRFKQAGTPGTAWPLDMPIVNGERSIYIVAVMSEAGSNAFRIRSVARDSAGGTSASLNTLAGLGGQFNTPLSIGRMPLTPGGSETFRVRFQVPCTPPTNSFNLGWFDADRPPGGIPYDTDINWVLVNVTTGQSLSSSTMAFVSGMSEDNYLLSNNQERIISIGNVNLPGFAMRVQAGDEYMFEWRNVDANNGIQVKIPYDEADRGASCSPPTGALTGTAVAHCTAITGNANDTDSSGTPLNIRVYKNATINYANLAQNLAGTGSANDNFSIDMRSHRDFGTDTYYVYAGDVNRSGAQTGQYTQIGTTTVGPCLRYSCGQITTAPTSPEPTQTFRVTVSFNVVLVSDGTASSIGSNGSPEPWYIHLEVTPGVFARAQIGNGTLASGVPSISAFRDVVAPSAGTYSANWWVRNSAAGADLNPPGTCGNPSGVTVVNKPYVQSFSGDVRACGPTSGRITTYNKGSTGAYAGSGTQVAAFANNTITEFVSAALRLTSPTKPKGLTFANIGAGQPASTYGGGFAGTTCIENYWNASAPLGTLPASPISNRQTVYMNGPVTISSPITYSAGPWTTANSPYFRLIVNGDIYIAPGVNQLDGDYIATGTIYSCADGSAPTATYVRDNCATRLRVFGNFIAPNVRLLRMISTLAAAAVGQDMNTSQAAEIFIHTPENWFADPNPTGGSSADPVNSITALPPIL